MRARSRFGGFTLIELLVVLALLALLMGIGAPALLNTLKREKLKGSARQTAVMMQIARAEAIKRGVNAGVTVSYATNEVISFVDVNQNDVFNAGDRELGRYVIPKDVTLYGPGDVEGGPHTQGNWGSVGEGFGFPENGLLEGVALFRPDGSADREGAFRLKDSRYPTSNYLEARLAPAATGRVTVRMFEGGDPADPDMWESPNEGDGWDWN